MFKACNILLQEAGMLIHTFRDKNTGEKTYNVLSIRLSIRLIDNREQATVRLKLYPISHMLCCIGDQYFVL